MNDIDELIQEFALTGVSHLKLKEFAEFANNGADKIIRDDESEVKLLNFKDVFNLEKITEKDITSCTSVPKNKLSSYLVRKLDIYITPSSEVPNEIGMSAVVSEDIPNTVYSYHIARIRIRDFDLVNPYFISYLFKSKSIRRQIQESSQGITRFGLTKPKWENLVFPIPPIETQNQIVKVLDSFLELDISLKIELDARKIQYGYYRDFLIDDDSIDRELVELGECLEKIERVNWKSNPNFEPNYVDLSSVDIESMSIVTTTKIAASTAPSRAQHLIKKNDVLFGSTRPTLNRICSVLEEYDGHVASTGFCVLRANPSKLFHRYLFHLLNSASFRLFVSEKQEGASYPSISESAIRAFSFKLPNLQEQERLSDILDKFLSLLINKTFGLPAEIVARRNQYEYYRDELLTFRTLEVS